MYITNSYNFKFLTPEEEKAIIERIKKEDKKAKEILIKAYTKMVISIAKRFYKNPIASFDDLVQEGCLALLSAAENFDFSYNIKFSSYAKMWIKEMIKRRFCKDLYVVSTPFRVVKKSFAVAKDKAFSKEVKKGENSAIINILKQPFYIDDKSENKKDTNFEIEADNICYYPHSKCEIKELFDTLKDCIKELDKREKTIIENRFFNAHRPTYIEIGQLLSISPETVRNIEKKAIKKIKVKMIKKGFKI